MLTAAEYAAQHVPALLPTLDAAVPLKILDLQGYDSYSLTVLAKQAVEQVAAHGDALMYRSERGATAEAMKHLIRGLAALAYCPGGVGFAGRHWCATDRGCAAWPPELCPRHRGAPPPAYEPSPSDPEPARQLVETVQLPLFDVGEVADAHPGR